MSIGLTGCDNHDHGYQVDYNNPYISSTMYEFMYEGDFSNYNNSDIYDWYTAYNYTFVYFLGIDFDGTVRIRIYDGLGYEVFNEFFVGQGMNSWQEVELSSYMGEHGIWQVRIDSIGVNGFVQLVLN
jgi:hypothetical protein